MKKRGSIEAAVNCLEPMINGFNARLVEVRILILDLFYLTRAPGFPGLVALPVNQEYFYYTGPNILPADAKVVIGNEAIAYVSVFGSNEVDLLTRGVEGSVAVEHNAPEMIKPVYQSYMSNSKQVIIPRPGFDCELQYRWKNENGWSKWSDGTIGYAPAPIPPLPIVITIDGTDYETAPIPIPEPPAETQPTLYRHRLPSIIQSLIIRSMKTRCFRRMTNLAGNWI